MVSIISCGASSSSFFMTRTIFFNSFHQVRFVLQTPCGIGNQDIHISRLRRLDGVKDHGRGTAPVCCAITGMLLRWPHTCSCSTATAARYHPPPASPIYPAARTTRQFADGGGLPDTVNANHQNNKWRLPSILSGSSTFCENFTHLVFSRPYSASASRSCCLQLALRSGWR